MIFLFYYFNATPKIQNCKQAAPVAHFAKRNTKFGGGKRGRGGHSFSPHPFFCPPRPSGLVLATPQARNQFRSKWVRALFKISHLKKRKNFWFKRIFVSNNGDNVKKLPNFVSITTFIDNSEF